MAYGEELLILSVDCLERHRGQWRWPAKVLGAKGEQDFNLAADQWQVSKLPQAEAQATHRQVNNAKRSTSTKQESAERPRKAHKPECSGQDHLEPHNAGHAVHAAAPLAGSPPVTQAEVDANSFCITFRSQAGAQVHFKVKASTSIDKVLHRSSCLYVCACALVQPLKCG